MAEGPEHERGVFISGVTGNGNAVGDNNSVINAFVEGAAALFAVKGVSPFLEAFAKRLGEQLGESTAAAMRRLRIARRGGRDVVEVATPAQSVFLEVDQETPVEGQLALLRLDSTAPELQGRTLRWDGELGAWRPVDDIGDTAVRRPEKGAR